MKWVTDNKNSILIAVASVLAICVGAYAVLQLRPDPQMAEARGLAQQLHSADVVPGARGPSSGELCVATLELSAEQCGELKREEAALVAENLKRFFELPASEQQAKLDEILDRQETARNGKQAIAGKKDKKDEKAAEAKTEEANEKKKKSGMEKLEETVLKQRGQQEQAKGRTNPRAALRRPNLDLSTPDERALQVRFQKQLEARRQARQSN